MMFVIINEKNVSISLDANSVLMNTFVHVDHSKGDPEICSTSWKRQNEAGCGLGMSCRDSVWFFPRLETLRFRPPAQKAFDAEGEALEHASTKSLAPPERSGQKFVLLSPAIS